MRIRKSYQGTLPENKIVNIESNSQTDTYSCDYINKYDGTVLYENSSGSNGSLTLNDTIFNYKYIEIFYKNNDGICNSVKIPIINTSTHAASLEANTVTSGVSYTKTRTISINENRIATRFENGHIEYTISSGGCSYLAANNYIYIIKVVGYR